MNIFFFRVRKNSQVLSSGRLFLSMTRKRKGLFSIYINLYPLEIHQKHDISMSNPQSLHNFKYFPIVQHQFPIYKILADFLSIKRMLTISFFSKKYFQDSKCFLCMNPFAFVKKHGFLTSGSWILFVPKHCIIIRNNCFMNKYL